GWHPCPLLDQGQDDLRFVRLHRVHAGEDKGALVCALEVWLERLRLAGRRGQGASAFESGVRHASRFLRAVLEPPCDRCIRSLELQEQNRVIAARTARALEVRARIVGPLELLCRVGCTQPGPRAIARCAQSVRDALPSLHRKPLLTELRGQGCEFALQLSFVRRAGRHRVDERDDRPEPVDAHQPAHRRPYDPPGKAYVVEPRSIRGFRRSHQNGEPPDRSATAAAARGSRAGFTARASSTVESWSSGPSVTRVSRSPSSRSKDVTSALTAVDRRPPTTSASGSPSAWAPRTR